MARNAEKAMTTLARWRAAQEGSNTPRDHRPFIASDCKELRQAERWRNQIISEVARKVAQIQNAGLGEFRIRDLNDEINKLLREKGHWEAHIRDGLGGTDHTSGGPKLFGTDGQEVPGNRGYKYFGAAKELPGVRELFEQEPAAPPRRTRGDLMKHVDADYYGYRDDDDGVLIPLEQLREKEAIQNLITDFKKAKLKERKGSKLNKTTDENNKNTETTDENNKNTETTDENKQNTETTAADGRNTEMEEEPINDDDYDIEVDASDERSEVLRYMAHVPNIPTQQQMEDALLERKKKDLLKQILGD